MQSSFIDVQGVRTRYLHEGAGEAVILLHGIGLSADCFIRNIDPLAERFSVYALDLLGHGFTDAVNFGTSVPQVVMAQHVVDFASRLGLTRYSLVGSSFGALVAGLVYFSNKDQVDKLVIVGSGSLFHSAEQQKLTLGASLKNGREAMTGTTLEKCHRRIANIVFDPACIPSEMLALQLTSYALPDRLSAYLAAITGSVEAMDDDNARVLSRLEDLRCPTLVIVGREDPRADWKTHLDGTKRMPSARISIYERCKHLPFLEHVNRFNREVGDFLKEATSQRKLATPWNA